MDDVLQEIRQFINWYREIYGDKVYLDGEPDWPVYADEAPAAPQPYVDDEKKTFRLKQLSPELDEFNRQIDHCQNCALGKLRKHFVFGYGNPNAEVMFIGEAPGREEDEQGIPFVGRAGKLLDKMLKAIKMKREDVFIANVLKCRPPNNRDPLEEEVRQCEPYLKKQLEIISPKLLVSLGRISAQVLLRYEDTLRGYRGKEQRYEDIPLIVTYHPAALLRNPQWKYNAWEDFKKIKNFLKSH